MRKPRISIIAAIGKNRELGKDNKLLWHIPEDLARFKKLTTGHPVIMGRKTFASIGRPLPDRTNIVITRSKTYTAPPCIVTHSIDEALNVVAHPRTSRSAPVRGKLGEPQSRSGAIYGTQNKDSSIEGVINHTTTKEAYQAGPKNQLPKAAGEAFIIGGAQIYQQTINIADRLYLTLVHSSFPSADTFFPPYKHLFPKTLSAEPHPSSTPPYTFLTLEH